MKRKQRIITYPFTDKYQNKCEFKRDDCLLETPTYDFRCLPIASQKKKKKDVYPSIKTKYKISCVKHISN